LDTRQKAPNMVPRGAIRLSEAFENLYQRLTPNWKDLSDRCEQWDEHSCHLQPEDLGEDPYPIAIVATDRAENLFRWALTDGHLRAYIHSVRTGIDLELGRREWRRSGEEVGINSDYTGPQMPGPDSTLDGVCQPVFLIREDFEQWLFRTLEGGNASPPVDVEPQQDNRSRILATRAFSVEDVIARIGLSKTKLYEEIEQGNLRAKKSGARTLILEPDLDAFLYGLQPV
jgi:hypothetical protein